MVIGSTREVALSTLEHSRSGREAAVAREREAAVQAVLQAAREDVGVTQTEAGDGASIRISAQLMTLDRSEFAALARVFRR